MIQDIAIEQLDIHPQNVRKVYTDIDELAESIKARGVMQNLTVVPNPDKKDHYLVVIGNRRLTAARKAGLKTMPCSVVEITEILKRMRRERNDFIKELVSGKITIPKEVDVKETGWKIMINRITDGGSVAHMNAVYGFYGIENAYEAKKEEKERIEKEFAEISQEKQMLILLTRTAEPYEATDYYGHYEKGMKCLRDFYRLLQQMGFSFRSLEELKILNGTHYSDSKRGTSVRHKQSSACTLDVQQAKE